MRSLVTCLLMLICHLVVAPVQAGPSPAIRYLMNTPVTLLDHGLERLEADLNAIDWSLDESFGGKGSSCDVRVSYSFDSNQIWFAFHLHIKYPERDDAKEIKKEIESILSFLRMFCGVNPETGRLDPEDPIDEYRLESYFSPKAFSLKSWPKGLGRELYDISEVALHFNILKVIGKRVKAKRMSCRTKLLGTADTLLCSELTEYK